MSSPISRKAIIPATITTRVVPTVRRRLATVWARFSRSVMTGSWPAGIRRGIRSATARRKRISRMLPTAITPIRRPLVLSQNRISPTASRIISLP